MMRRVISCAILIALVSPSLADSELKVAWKAVTAEHDGEWGYGFMHERRGQICDTYRQYGQEEIEEDKWKGCTVLFIADPDDEWDLGTVAEGEQDNFLNTQHYKQAWNLHDKGFLGNSLPRAAKDLDPVCLFALVDGQYVLGYEEGEGDKLLPCPGHRTGAPFDQETILAAMNDTALAEEMCTQCYQSVCTGRGATRARDCGNSGDGGKDLEDTATFVQQADPVYHCHLTMADEGACDYVQYIQHERDRTYYMDYSVTCGWDNIQYLNITFCDCTKVAGTANNCRRYEAMEMAYAGVVCGNCNGAGFNEDVAFTGIFSPRSERNPYAGRCAEAKMYGDEELGKNYSKMMCSKGIWCPQGYNGGDNCKFHCDYYGKDSDIWYDPECGDYPDFPRELCLEDDSKCFYLPDEDEKTWMQAEAICESEFGAKLATIESAEEDALVHRLAIASRRDVWIGYNDRASEGIWQWLEATLSEYTNWEGNEPNDAGGNEDCAEVNPGGGQWNDQTCGERNAFVCSKAGAFTGEASDRRLLGMPALEAPREITLDTKFDWGHVVSDVRATGWEIKRQRKTL